jgi:hypothetical protein
MRIFTSVFIKIQFVMRLGVFGDFEALERGQRPPSLRRIISAQNA